MARFFSNSKIVSAFIVDSVSAAINRRGYAAASQGVVKGVVVRNNVMMKKGVEESNKTTSWVPDPVTGYYRPETHVNKEIDAAELRKMLLKHKPSQH